jgi:hypothetical protein
MQDSSVWQTVEVLIIRVTSMSSFVGVEEENHAIITRVQINTDNDKW